MKYVQLGKSGLRVSQVVLGSMSFGVPELGLPSHRWSLGASESRPLIRKALELGITTFDTADVYSQGSSEEILGKALADFADREDVVIATNVAGRMRESPNGVGLSRAHIMSAIDASSRRLGTDYIDLYQIHAWDPSTPIEETLATLDDLIRLGKVRYIGASSMWAWQFAKAQYTADLGGWTRFISMKNQYNLINREDEREMHPFCLDQGVGVLPWSPLARGHLTREIGTESARTGRDSFGQQMYGTLRGSDIAVIRAVAAVAANRGIPRAQVALAWMHHRQAVTAPIVGATRMSHIEDAVASTEIDLNSDEIDLLEASYEPRMPFIS